MSKHSKLNHDFLKQYSTVFADKLLQKAYQDKSHLTGKDILNLSSIKQLNLFVIKAFFTEWQDEVKKLESPLFDYQNKDVRKAMVTFMNVLSQHIHIEQKHLKSYVERALVDTVLLVYDPAEFLQIELGDNKPLRLGQKQIRPLLKYLVIYKEEFQEYLQSVENESVREALSKAELYFEDFDTQASLDELIGMLSEYLILDEAELLVPEFSQKGEVEEEELTVDEEIEEEVAQTELTASSSDYFGGSFEEDEPEQEPEVMDVDDESVEEEDLEEEADMGEEEWDEEELDKETEEAETEQEDVRTYPEHQNQVITSRQLIREMEEDEETEEVESDSINSKFEADHKTLAELHEGKKVNTVFDAISINHRYMFLQELFDGDNELFTSALKEVDECETFDEAVEMLVQNYAKEFFWDMNSDEVKELLKVVYRKFRE
jgi:hypothetical protein